MKTHKKATLTRQTILGTLRQNRGVLERYSVRRIGLFGSYATGRQTERSDIDFVVEFEQPTYDNLVRLSRELRRLFGKKIELITPDGLKSIRVKGVAEGIRKALAYA